MVWSQYVYEASTGFEHDASDDDESLSADRSKWLVVDAPGFRSLPIEPGSTCALKLKAREWMEAGIGDRWYPISSYVYWRCILHAKYNEEDETWVFEADSEIVQGTISDFAGTWSD